jgi:hypothetical protein
MARNSGANMRWLLGLFFDHQLNELRDYIRTIEKALSERFDEFENEINQRTEEMSQEQKGQYVEIMADDAFQLADRFPSMVRKTSFVFLYGLFEHSLLNLCDLVRKYGQFKESATDGGDKGITAAQNYLKSVANVKFPDQSPEWNEIRRLAQIRNCLVHGQGRIKGEPSKAILAYIRRKSGMIELYGMNELKLNAVFCDDAIKVIRKFFAAVLHSVPDELLSTTEQEEIH